MSNNLGPSAEPPHNPIRRFSTSVSCALSGISFTFKTERHFKFHVLAAAVAIGLGLYLQLSPVEWALIVFAIEFVLVSELFNTALERLCDETADGRWCELIRRAKDIAAGAVLLSAASALVVGILILGIPLIRRLF